MGNINIEIPNELHKKLRKLKAEKDINIKDLIIAALEKYVENEEVK